MVQISSLFALAVASRVANSHFLLQFPSTIGFDDDNEGIAPCGGFTADFTGANVTQFHVDGDAIALMSTHPEAKWLFRATLGTSLSSASNWTNLLPVISQDSLGEFCETNVKAPSEWAGSQGIMQIVQDAADGFLYQCAALNFTAGTASSIPSSCSNATGLTAQFTSDAALSAVPVTASATSSASATASVSAAAAPSTYAAHDTLGAFLWMGMAALGVATALVSL